MKRTLGKTGRELFCIGLGGMPLSIEGRPDEKKGIAVIHAAIDAGVEFIDTANVYCIDNQDLGHNERLISKALKLKGSPQAVVVATKGGLSRPHGDWTALASPKDLRRACEKSLKDLQVETLFLYQLHAPDPHVPLEESVGELAKLKKEGKISHIGLSNVTSAQLELALKLTRIESVQNQCNIFYQRDRKNGLIELCAKNEVTYIAYSPVGGGLGHLRVAQHPLLIDLAEKYETSAYCIALGWLLGLGKNVLPIPGASRVKSILDSVKAVKINLTAEDKIKINEINL